MSETLQTINEWTEATFGTTASHTRVIVRALEEASELGRKVTTGREGEAPEECADVFIILCRLGVRLGFDPYYVFGQTLVVPGTAEDEAAEVCYHLARAWRYAGKSGVHPTVVPGALMNAAEHLHRCARRLGASLRAEVDAKMAINRAREWNLDGSGHGYHVREKEVSV